MNAIANLMNDDSMLMELLSLFGHRDSCVRRDGICPSAQCGQAPRQRHQ